MIDPQQKENIATLVTDLLKIHSDSDVTPEQIQQLKEDVLNLWTTYPPDPDTVTTLEEDIKKMIAAHQVNRDLLKDDLKAMVESMGVPPGEKLKLKLELLAIAEASHIGPDDVDTIQDDLQKIVDTAQANHATKRRHA